LPASVSPRSFAHAHCSDRQLGKGWNASRPLFPAAAMRNRRRAGLRGVGISIVNYADELPFFCNEAIPLLERMRLREKQRTSFSGADKGRAARKAPDSPGWAIR
jgi:hypothetical protein